MQTAQRRIPIGGDDGKNKTWAELLPHYEKELHNFRENIQLLKSDKQGKSGAHVLPLIPAEVKIISPKAEQVALTKGQRIQAGGESFIEEIAPELQHMKAFRLDAASQRENGTILEFETAGSVKLLDRIFQG